LKSFAVSPLLKQGWGGMGLFTGLPLGMKNQLIVPVYFVPLA
jgi:hypothetical protein